MNLTKDCKELEIKHKIEQEKEKTMQEQADYIKSLKELGIDIYY